MARPARSCQSGPVSTLLGVNVPYLRGDYGHDLAENPRFPTWPCRFDAMTAYRPIIEARRIGFEAVRIWLCENGEGVRLEGDEVSGVSERLIESVQILQECAALHGARIYWSLLDGNAVAREGDPVTRAVLSRPDAAARFAEHVAAPLARVFAPELTFGVELVNEPETTTAACGADDPIAWETIGASLRTIGDAVRAERTTHVTAGATHVFLPALFEVDPGLTALDLHMYHPGGGLPSRADLAAQVGEAAAALPLIAGEAGIPKDPPPTEPAAMRNYVHNARSLGYEAAFLWQLEGDLIDKREGRPWTRLAEQVAHALGARPVDR